MNKRPLNEATGLAQQILRAVLATCVHPSTPSGAKLTWMCSYMTVNAANQLNLPQSPFFANFSACFNQAVVAGATFAQIDVVRVLAMSLQPVSGLAIAVVNYATRMALIEQALILAATTFNSREQIDDFLNQINASCNAAEEIAADNHDNVAYTLMVNLHGAVVNDLSTRALPLPEIVTFNFAVRLPSLFLAQRIYQDASRNDTLVAMNRVSHPAFMPTTVRGLSV
jgi:prophage DNA circulation protein